MDLVFQETSIGDHDFNSGICCLGKFNERHVITGYGIIHIPYNFKTARRIERKTALLFPFRYR